MYKNACRGNPPSSPTSALLVPPSAQLGHAGQPISGVPIPLDAWMFANNPKSSPMESRRGRLFDASSSSAASAASTPPQPLSGGRNSRSASTSMFDPEFSPRHIGYPVPLNPPNHMQNRPPTRTSASAAESDGQEWKTLLHIAAEKGHEAVVKTLLDRDVDIDERDSCGSTALHLATKHKHEGVLRLLLENGADVNASDDSGWTPTHEAAENGFAAGLKLLARYGASLTLKARSME